VLGTSAAECSGSFAARATDKRIVMSDDEPQDHRDVYGRYAAARSFMAAAPDVAIDVVDTATTDLGAALVTIFAGEAALAGKPQLEVVGLAERFASGGHLRFHVEDIEYLVKGGRAMLHPRVARRGPEGHPHPRLRARRAQSARARGPREGAIPILIEQLKTEVAPGRSVVGRRRAWRERKPRQTGRGSATATWNVERLYMRPLSPVDLSPRRARIGGCVRLSGRLDAVRPEPRRGDL
jgi:hypothetical protein